MKITSLKPLPTGRVQFAWSHFKQVPEQPGCYALATFSDDVLYVGLATSSISSRILAHLDNSEKRTGGRLGVPFWCYFLLVHEAHAVGTIERGWINQAILEDGEMPCLNKVHSPV